MALRVRKDGTVLCAAKSDAELGDFYVPDGIHGSLLGYFMAMFQENAAGGRYLAHEEPGPRFLAALERGKEKL